MPKKEAVGAATLTLTITYNHIRLLDVIEAAKEIVEKATEQGAVEGYLDLHSTDRIDVEDLR